MDNGRMGEAEFKKIFDTLNELADSVKRGEGNNYLM